MDGGRGEKCKVFSELRKIKANSKIMEKVTDEDRQTFTNEADNIMMAHSSQTRIDGKIDGQFLHASWSKKARWWL